MAVQARLAILPAGQKVFELLEVDLPEPGPHEVLVEQKAFGICHSQLDRIDTERLEPMVIGHESTGVVLAVGSAVETIQVGEEVLLSWMSKSPGGSRKPGTPRIPLPDGRVAVTPNVFAWGTHALVDELFLVQASPGVPADLSSIIGCAIMTGSGSVLNTAQDVAGKDVAVWGVGGVGGAAVAAAKALGAANVIAVDINDAKLALARSLGADRTVNALQGDPVEAVRALTRDGNGVDFSIDCTGRGDNTALSLKAVRVGVWGLHRGGAVILVGIPRTPVEFNAEDVVYGQRRIFGSLGGECSTQRDFPIFSEWYLDGRLDLNSLVTDRYSLDQINEGVQDLRSGKILGRAIVEL